VISVTKGDILKSNKQALVNTVNCVGVMGKGIALAFKRSYPNMYEDYVSRCQRGEVKLGQPYVYRESDGHIIVNFPTKSHWRAVSRLSDIVDGIRYMREHYVEWGIGSIAVPPLGCGNGQLEWKVVGPTLHHELSLLNIDVELYAPAETPPEEMQLDFFADFSEPVTSTFVEPSWVALVETIRRIELSPNHWPVGRTRFQKLAYFLASAGLPMGFEYERGPYGPYSPQLKPVVSKLVNNGILSEIPSGSMILMQVGPTFSDARKAFEDELNDWDDIIESVADLFVRMRTDQTEVAATVHYVANELRIQLGAPPTDKQIIDEVLQWKLLRGHFTPNVVAASVRSLAVLGWIQINPSSDFAFDDDMASIA
jgi:O-acetyl-ADP-ribose deacetylase (regulator of RNase III)/uncharacterized protein YwgA